MLFDFVAHPADLPFGDDVAVAEQDHLIGDGIHFMQDVAGDKDVHAVLRQSSK